MTFKKKDLLEIAKNARIKLTDKEVSELLPELQEILTLFELLDKVDTKKILPAFQPIKIENVSREDSITPSFDHEEVFLNVKNRKGNYFKGPKAI
tara:strand:- start:397 stop:681 length:285 start_codon:yes stop_codon:yes gene_type:complete